MKRVSTKSIWMIVSSFLASAALIATLAIGMTAGSWKPNNAFVIGLIALAALVFAGTVAVRLMRRGYVRKLNEHYYAEYEKISDALGNAVMSSAEQKETKEDIVSLMLEAQEQGRDVQEVVGGDINAFIKRIQESFGYRNRLLFQVLSVIQYGVFFFVLMQSLVYFEQGGEVGFFDVRIAFNMFVMFMVVIFVIYPVSRNAMRKDKTVLPFVLPLASGIVYIGLLILLDKTLRHFEWVRFFLDSEVRMIGAWWLLAALATVMLAAQCVKWALRRRSLKTL